MKRTPPRFTGRVGHAALLGDEDSLQRLVGTRCKASRSSRLTGVRK